MGSRSYGCVGIACMLLASGCASESAGDSAVHAERRSEAAEAGSGARPSLDDVELSADGRPLLCERDRSDKVRETFCANPPLSITSLGELEERLGLVPGGLDTANATAYGANSFVTLLSHSTALSGQLVSSLNPRLIVIGDRIVMAYQRGAQKVEIAAQGRDAGYYNYYLLEFEQACNRSEAGCKPGDLFTPSIERDWLRTVIRDDEDLANTPQDCRQCHQRATDFPQLLMRELESPWTHFFLPFPQPDRFVGPGVQGHDLSRDRATGTATASSRRHATSGSATARPCCTRAAYRILARRSPAATTGPRSTARRAHRHDRRRRPTRAGPPLAYQAT